MLGFRAERVSGPSDGESRGITKRGLLPSWLPHPRERPEACVGRLGAVASRPERVCRESRRWLALTEANQVPGWLANGGAGRDRFLGMRQEALVDQEDRLAEQVIGDGPWVHEGLLS